MIPKDLQSVYHITLMILAIGYIIKSLETIAISKTFLPRQPNDWDLVGMDSLQTGKAYPLFKTLYSRKGVITLCILTILISLYLLLAPVNIYFNLLVLLLFVLQFILHHRQEFGGDGADQMSFLVLTTFTICFTFITDSRVHTIGVVFVAAQLILSYIISGGAKLISTEWRNGTAVQGILSSYTYGTEFTKVLFNKSLFLSRIMCWMVVAVELLFPMALFFTDTVFYSAVIMGILLHLSIGVVMGLNDFVWSFLAAYPSLIFIYITYIH